MDTRERQDTARQEFLAKYASGWDWTAQHLGEYHDMGAMLAAYRAERAAAGWCDRCGFEGCDACRATVAQATIDVASITIREVVR